LNKALKSEEWHCITFDSYLLKSGKQSFNLFREEGPDNLVDKATSRIESDIVKWIFESKTSNYHYLLYEGIGLSDDYKPFLSCKKYLLDNEYYEPDIDVLLVNEKMPNLSIAMQVKRIKIEINEDLKADYNRLHVIEEGIKQANIVYKKYKFHKNYLLVVVIIDGINKKVVNQIFRQPGSDELYKNIHSLRNFEGLNENIGIFAYEITQPTNESIDKRATIYSKELKTPKPIEQPSVLTERILKHIKWAKDNINN